MKVFEGITRERLDNILHGIGNVRAALVGDICLDVYWRADMTKSELSRETPHFPLPVVEEWMSPGAGGNAAANIAVLRPRSIKVLGVIGRDWRGDALVRVLGELGIDTESMIISSRRVTNAYCKPLRKGISDVEYEDPRIDFYNYEQLGCEDEQNVLELLDKVVKDIDVLFVCDQFLYGCITPSVRDKVISFSREGMKVVVDSRDRIGLYEDVIMKPNELEGLKAAYGGDISPVLSLNECIVAAKTLAGKNRSEVCMTLGAKGCLYVNSQTVTHIPSYQVPPPIDICGAGDTFLSAFSCAYAAGASACEAAFLANLAANVTVRKVGMTGTASPEEIMDRYSEVFPGIGKG